VAGFGVSLGDRAPMNGGMVYPMVTRDHESPHAGANEAACGRRSGQPVIPGKRRAAAPLVANARIGGGPAHATTPISSRWRENGVDF
jgi:hypothetical protein